MKDAVIKGGFFSRPKNETFVYDDSMLRWAENSARDTIG